MQGREDGMVFRRQKSEFRRPQNRAQPKSINYEKP
jgi:hypothetical protein